MKLSKSPHKLFPFCNSSLTTWFCHNQQQLHSEKKPMYKTRLQELCHQRSWNLPKYSTTKHGLDHNPRFQATVALHDVAFTTLNLFRSSKEAQNDAARLAFEHFSSSRPNPPPPSRPFVSSSSGNVTVNDKLIGMIVFGRIFVFDSV